MVWKLFYDGGCNLCHTSKLKAEKWAERAKQPMEVDILQSDEAIEKGYQGDVMVLEADGQVYYGADAWLKIMTIAPWYLRWLSWTRYTPPTRWLARIAYGLVARMRYKLFGTRACPIPGARPVPRH
jgi:predicted DCC family thiol-disulfide oxidoreductase YuxK